MFHQLALACFAQPRLTIYGEEQGYRLLKINLTKSLFLLAWGPAILYMAIIFTLSSLPSLPQPPGFFAWDKLQHTSAYVVLGLVLYRAAAMLPMVRGIGPAVHTLILGALYGLSDEFHQKFVPGRSSDIHDWYADITGLTIGVIILAVIGKFRKHGGKNRGRK